VLSINAYGQTQPGTQPGYATVARIQGEARYSTGDNEWHALTVGQTLTAGSIVQTAGDSTVDLILGARIPFHLNSHPDKIAPAPDANVRGLTSYKAAAEQNVVHLQGNTVLAINQLTIADTGVDAVSDTELDLRQGTIFGNVKKLSAASQYLIKIPSGIAGVRGTTFVMSADGAITVVQGSMVISTMVNGQPVTMALGPGDQYDPATGQVTHLTHEEFAQAMRLAVQVITVVEGILSFGDDGTTIYISPVHGKHH
jgi:FecR protein